jgi:hypothetical protein
VPVPAACLKEYAVNARQVGAACFDELCFTGSLFLEFAGVGFSDFSHLNKKPANLAGFENANLKRA